MQIRLIPLAKPFAAVEPGRNREENPVNHVVGLSIRTESPRLAAAGVVALGERHKNRHRRIDGAAVGIGRREVVKISEVAAARGKFHLPRNGIGDEEITLPRFRFDRARSVQIGEIADASFKRIRSAAGETELSAA